MCICSFVARVGFIIRQRCYTSRSTQMCSRFRGCGTLRRIHHWQRCSHLPFLYLPSSGPLTYRGWDVEIQFRSRSPGFRPPRPRRGLVSCCRRHSPCIPHHNNECLWWRLLDDRHSNDGRPVRCASAIPLPFSPPLYNLTHPPVLSRLVLWWWLASG